MVEKETVTTEDPDLKTPAELLHAINRAYWHEALEMLIQLKKQARAEGYHEGFKAGREINWPHEDEHDIKDAEAALKDIEENGSVKFEDLKRKIPTDEEVLIAAVETRDQRIWIRDDKIKKLEAKIKNAGIE